MNKGLIELSDGILIETDLETAESKELELVSAAAEKNFYQNPVKVPNPFKNMLKNTIVKIGSSVGEAMAELSDKYESNDYEVQLEIGMKFTGGGKIYVVSARGEASLKITMKITKNR